MPSSSKSPLVILLAAALPATGCIKYTPSYAELERSRGSKAAEFAGPEKFASMEAERRARLAEFLAERSTIGAAGVDQGYRIGAGDVLEMEVFGLSELKGPLEVSPTGTIAPALVGELPAAGRTVAELRSALVRAYGPYVRNPEVRLSVKDFQASRVSVVGAVSRPGTYPLRRVGASLMDLLAEAGGRGDTAGTRVLVVPARRGAAGWAGGEPVKVASAVAALGTGPGTDAAAAPVSAPGPRGIEVELSDLEGSFDRAPLVLPLLPGDVVTVPEAGNVEVDGEVEKPGSYKLTSKLSVAGAVAAAGGTTYSADTKAVEVVRDFGEGKRAVMTVDLDQDVAADHKELVLRPGDLVRVPSESSRFYRRQVIEFFRNIFRTNVPVR